MVARQASSSSSVIGVPPSACSPRRATAACAPRLAFELLLDQLLVGDVQHDPVPEERSVGRRGRARSCRGSRRRARPCGACGSPDRTCPSWYSSPAAAAASAACTSAASSSSAACAILGVKLARPEVLVAGPLLDGEAEDRLDPLVHVLPGAVRTGRGDEDDCRHALDDRLVVNPGLRLVRCPSTRCSRQRCEALQTWTRHCVLSRPHCAGSLARRLRFAQVAACGRSDGGREVAQLRP